MNESYLLISIPSKSCDSWNWTAIGVFIALASSIIALLIGQCRASSDNKIKNSLFYLEQIKQYFTNAISLLADGNNNNVKWHQAVQCLKTADGDLRTKITVKSHKHIYLFDYLNTAYEILDILKKIDDFKFFYGVSYYKEKNEDELYNETKSQPLGHSSRIDPDSLNYLCQFIDKANCINQDLNGNKNDWELIYNSEYFKSPITKTKQLSCFTELSMEIVLAYIKNYRLHQNK